MKIKSAKEFFEQIQPRQTFWVTQPQGGRLTVLVFTWTTSTTQDKDAILRVNVPHHGSQPMKLATLLEAGVYTDVTEAANVARRRQGRRGQRRRS